MFSFPLFSQNLHISSPVSGKYLFFPYFLTCPPLFVSCFLLNLRVLLSPFFDHDVFRHHAMDALDALADFSTRILLHLVTVNWDINCALVSLACPSSSLC